jgi:hypothetical protein
VASTTPGSSVGVSGGPHAGTARISIATTMSEALARIYDSLLGSRILHFYRARANSVHRAGWWSPDESMDNHTVNLRGRSVHATRRAEAGVGATIWPKSVECVQLSLGVARASIHRAKVCLSMLQPVAVGSLRNSRQLFTTGHFFSSATNFTNYHEGGDKN